MSIVDIIKRGLQIARTHRSLWLFAFVVGLGSASVNGGSGGRGADAAGGGAPGGVAIAVLLAAGVAFVIGICAAPVFVLSETLLQRGAVLEQRGRVFSARDFMMRLAFMFAVAAAGAVTRANGTSLALLSGAGLVLFAGLVTIGWEGVRDVNEGQSGRGV